MIAYNIRRICTCVKVDFLRAPQGILAVRTTHKEGVGRVLLKVQQRETPDNMSSFKIMASNQATPKIWAKVFWAILSHTKIFQIRIFLIRYLGLATKRLPNIGPCFCSENTSTALSFLSLLPTILIIQHEQNHQHEHHFEYIKDAKYHLLSELKLLPLQLSPGAEGKKPHKRTPKKLRKNK